MANSWYLFWDMHSGGSQKLDWSSIYIEDQSRAIAIAAFESLFQRDPDHVTCLCCGPDYSISDHDSLEQASAYHRSCAFEGGRWVEEPNTAYGADPRTYRTLTQYLQDPDVKVVRRGDY